MEWTRIKLDRNLASFLLRPSSNLSLSGSTILTSSRWTRNDRENLRGNLKYFFFFEISIFRGFLFNFCGISQEISWLMSSCWKRRQQINRLTFHFEIHFFLLHHSRPLPHHSHCLFRRIFRFPKKYFGTIYCVKLGAQPLEFNEEGWIPSFFFLLKDSRQIARF